MAAVTAANFDSSFPRTRYSRPAVPDLPAKSASARCCGAPTAQHSGSRQPPRPDKSARAPAIVVMLILPGDAEGTPALRQFIAHLPSSNMKLEKSEVNAP